ncbi:MAG: glycosyl transferase [Candidatus Electrothrix sp. AW5]|nr:glycosyl transferase [Candidatus Electrothrix gigas]
MQPEHYVTIFDNNFIPQGLCLHNSLRENEEKFYLWVICLDDECKTTLDNIGYSDIKTISLKNVETTELLALKPTRNKAEYCWTLTPFAPRWVFEIDPTIKRVTYVDADMYFFKSPQPLFEEFESSGKAVMITDHFYAPEFDQSATSGQYCVQFMPFVRQASEPVRKWWEKRCVEWCYQRMEKGKFGDQKYVESFPIIFPDKVHICQQENAFLAPWNASRYPYSTCIGYHFHGLRLLDHGTVRLYPSEYLIPRPTKKNIYHKYMSVFSSALLVTEWNLEKKTKKVKTSFLPRLRNNMHRLFFLYFNKLIEKGEKYKKDNESLFVLFL